MSSRGSHSGPAVSVRNLVTHYGKKQILNNVSLDIVPEEIMVIMGGSGSGKSTLMRYILGLNPPTAGTIEILGRDITTMSEIEMYDLRKDMGVSFQSGALIRSLTVGENVCMPLKEHTKLDENTMRIMARMKLEVVNLANFEDLMPSELSGGMIKRAALARAIVMDPKLLFFDEPSAGLDPVVAAELDDLILNMRADMGMTIVVVTHELESAFKIADRITILDQGEILMTGTVDEVKQSKNKRIQDLLNRRPRQEEIDPEAYLRRLLGEKDDDPNAFGY